MEVWNFDVNMDQVKRIGQNQVAGSLARVNAILAQSFIYQKCPHRADRVEG